MRYFILETLGDDQDKSLAFIDKSPGDLGIYDYCMARGEVVVDHYPTEARVYLQPESPGGKLCSLIGNTLGYLIVSTEMKTVIEQMYKGKMELLPFTLYNHKGRVHSRDYWIINPIGSIDCLDKEASQIKYLNSSKKEVIAVDKFVLDPRKLSMEPDVFRVPEDLTRYFISARLGKAFQERGFTNIFLIEVDQANVEH